MKVEQKGHMTIIRDTQGKTEDFLQKLLREYNSYKGQNLILDLSYNKELTMADVKLFMDVTKKHSKEKKSLVLVVDGIDFGEVPDKITAVPTILEAQNIIEMEEIERDLGF